MSVAEEAVRQAREAVHRALSVIDSFRPKVLYKGNLTDLLAGQAVGFRPLERIRKRLGLGGGLLGGYAAPTTVSYETPSEASGLIVEKKDTQKTFIY